MSEYQYYEFQAVDRPLDDRAMAALRALTSRAEITPHSLVNVYHYGDFKGNPRRLMEQYFDAFLYLANWGTHRLMLRLPRRLFDPAAVEPYCVPEVLEADTTQEHVILDFESREEEGDWEEGGEGMLASLIPLRADLLAGDVRCLYLGWLVGVDHGEVDDDQLEPPVPPGLAELSGSLMALANFLRVDEDLIAAAAATSPSMTSLEPAADEFAAWVTALPESEKDALLLAVLRGESPHLRSELLRRFRDERAEAALRSGVRPVNVPARRTAGSLLEAQNVVAEERRRAAAARAAEERARRAQEQAAARARHLDSLVGQEEDLWRQAETAIARKLPREYDRAVEVLRDLRDLGIRVGSAQAFEERLQQLRERHSSKRTLLERLRKAGLSG